MPTISMFYGISIKMYFSDHFPPHFHAIYGDKNGMFDIRTLEMIEGDLNFRARELIKEWGEKHKDELLKIWETKEYHKISGLE